MHRGMGEERSYVTSKECQGCHTRHYEGWNETLHPKIFRPVTVDKLIYLKPVIPEDRVFDQLQKKEALPI